MLRLFKWKWGINLENWKVVYLKSSLCISLTFCHKLIVWWGSTCESKGSNIATSCVAWHVLYIYDSLLIYHCITETFSLSLSFNLVTSPCSSFEGIFLSPSRLFYSVFMCLHLAGCGSKDHSNTCKWGICEATAEGVGTPIGATWMKDPLK